MSRLTIVANRLPYQLSKTDDGQWQATPSHGGLVSALTPILQKQKGQWIGWDGLDHGESRELYSSLDEIIPDAGFSLQAVSLTDKEHHEYYAGFSNEVIWPLFHNHPTRCNFDPEYWRTYLKVNQRFSNVVAENCNDDDFIWVHDYHLMKVGQSLREQGIRSTIGFFLHIPFPPPEVFFQLPWRIEFLRGVLQYDLIGFQTQQDTYNFLQSVKTLFKNVRVRKEGATFAIEIGTRNDDLDQFNDRIICAGTFPISINFNDFESRANSSEVQKLCKRIRTDLPDRKIIFGLERLDYTKGIPNKLEAYRNALERFPELHRNVTLIQCVVPSRENIPEYQNMKQEIECLVSEINGAYTESGWVPIHYIYSSLNSTELVAYYLAADIALVTPVKDGMNLVAKEYCAVNIEEDGVLILSEFAGAAAQLGNDALSINPFDIEGTAEKIRQAFLMTHEERRTRMSRLRNLCREHDIFRWADSYITTALQWREAEII